jgi:hypothetical protein
VEDILKTQPKNFWKYISRFKHYEHVVKQLKIGQQVITEAQSIVEVFADHFSTILTIPLQSLFQTTLNL